MFKWLYQSNYQKMIKEIQRVNQSVNAGHVGLHFGMELIHNIFSHYDLGYLYEDVNRAVMLSTQLNGEAFQRFVNHSVSLLQYMNKGWS